MLLDGYYTFMVIVISLLLPLLSVKNSATLVLLLKNQPELRSSFYIQGIVMQWLLFISVMAAMWIKSDDWMLIGWSMERMLMGWSAIILLVLLSCVFYSFGSINTKIQHWVAQLYGHVAHYLPTDRRSYRWGVLLSVSAGICEEVIYRGYLFWQFSLWFDEWLAVMLVNLIFAMTHYSTGLKNALWSFVLGVLFSVIYLFTGDLWLSIVLHVWIDLMAITLYPMSQQPKND